MIGLISSRGTLGCDRLKEPAPNLIGMMASCWPAEGLEESVAAQGPYVIACFAHGYRLIFGLNLPETLLAFSRFFRGFSGASRRVTSGNSHKWHLDTQAYTHIPSDSLLTVGLMLVFAVLNFSQHLSAFDPRPL